MIHPVVRLAAAQPMLLAHHVQAYAGLVTQELALSGAALQRRLTLQVASALCLTVAVVLAGVAVLLWATLPLAGATAPWLLVATPALPAVAGLWAWWQAQAQPGPELFASVREQLAQDAALLGRINTP